MAEQRNRWNWEVKGFEPKKTSSEEENKIRSPAPLARRFSISIGGGGGGAAAGQQELRRLALVSKLERLKGKVKLRASYDQDGNFVIQSLYFEEESKLAKEDYINLKQEATDLQEYSDAKLDRIARYLGVLADKTRKLDQVALEYEARISPLISERKRLFNELLTAKGNVKVFCRTRPLFEDEGPSVVEFPDECTIRISTGDDTLSHPKKDYEFDRVYGPHVGQAELFRDIQPFVQSALDGYNVALFAYGQTRSGKTYTMEGSDHDRGLYTRCFEELFDLSNLDSTSSSRYSFSITVSEIYKEQTRDLIAESGKSGQKVSMGLSGSDVELVSEKVDNPQSFSRVLKAALLSRGADVSKFNVSHLIVTIHIYYSNLITKENLYSKLSLVDLARSDGLTEEINGGEHVTDLLHVTQCLSTLGDVLSSLTSKKDVIPYENSSLTNVLADSMGGNAKTLMIVTIRPDVSSLSETLSSLNFSARSRSAMLSLGNRDTIKKWRDIANDARKELYEKEKEINNLKQEVMRLQGALNDRSDHHAQLLSKVQKLENIEDKHKIEKEQNSQLRTQVAQLLRVEQEQKAQLEQKDATIQDLQAKVKGLEVQLEGLRSLDSTSGPAHHATNSSEGNTDSSAVTKKLEEELVKRDALIERLHQENEKLFDRLTKACSVGSSEVSSPFSSGKLLGQRAVSVPRAADKVETSVALVKSGNEKVKSTPAGEYLTAALNDFDPEQYDSVAAISDGANKLLMLVLAAVIKAGASREHEILAEIRDAVFTFVRKMEPMRVMDTMLVSRVRILYIRSLLARSPELQSIKVPPVQRFLEKATGGRSRSSSRGSSPGRSPGHHDSVTRFSLVDERVHGFKVNIRQEKKSKLSSVVLKLRGIDEDTWRQHVTGGKLREITEEAKSFAIGNKSLAALFVHTPAGELQRDIRSWLADNFDFLSVTGEDAVGGGTGQLELLSTAIMDGWMAGLGCAMPPTTDALGHLLSEYTKRVYNSQLHHLKDIAGTLAMELAEDAAQVAKLRSALESVDHKRRKILTQMRSDIALLALENGGSPVRNPSTATEDARLASLISLDGIVKQVKDIVRQASTSSLSRSRKRAMLESLDELEERMPSLLDIDHPCAQMQIAEARRLVESTVEEDDRFQSQQGSKTSESLSGTETDVSQWNVLQFNTGSTTPFIIKCGANSNSELVIKADARVQEPKGSEIVRVVPRPTVLENMSLDEIKRVFSDLPEALSLLALARTADGTRARYSRLYRTLAMKVPALRDLVSELEKGGILKDKDKASALAEAVRRLRELNRIAANSRSSVVGRSATLTRLQASSISTYIGGLLLPDDTDDVSVHPSKADSSIVIATLSCEDREMIIPENTRAVRSAKGRIVRVEMATIGSRIQIKLWVQVAGAVGGTAAADGASSRSRALLTALEQVVEKNTCSPLSKGSRHLKALHLGSLLVSRMQTPVFHSKSY
ncbi:Kinesin-like protein [Drosera capensis]